MTSPPDWSAPEQPMGLTGVREPVALSDEMIHAACAAVHGADWQAWNASAYWDMKRALEAAIEVSHG